MWRKHRKSQQSCRGKLNGNTVRPAFCSYFPLLAPPMSCIRFVLRLAQLIVWVSWDLPYILRFMYRLETNQNCVISGATWWAEICSHTTWHGYFGLCTFPRRSVGCICWGSKGAKVFRSWERIACHLPGELPKMSLSIKFLSKVSRGIIAFLEVWGW